MREIDAATFEQRTLLDDAAHAAATVSRPGISAETAAFHRFKARHDPGLKIGEIVARAGNVHDEAALLPILDAARPQRALADVLAVLHAVEVDSGHGLVRRAPCLTDRFTKR